MSLARLLAAGKSVVGISSGETRYRMHPKRLLPNFGSARNPFEAKPGETEAVAPAAGPAPAPVERVESFAAGATPLAAAVVAPTVANLPGASAASPVSGGQDSRWVRWRQRLARAAGWGKPRGQSPFGGTPVQSELKLE
ncbi:hypothetical protein EG829_30660, partial [bacterium]|nr:hypothetical protein [bacterium]